MDESGNQEGISSVSGIYCCPDKEGKASNMAGWIENLTLGTTWDKSHGPYGDKVTPLMRNMSYGHPSSVEIKLKTSLTETHFIPKDLFLSGRNPQR